jgi:asparagine synthase (glutamine-hydrolysing)
MCGIAGIVDLTGSRAVADGIIERMTAAIIHRGPDEEGYFRRPGVVLGSRRLSIVGLADGQQPVANEDRSVSVIYNGEFFDYPEKRAELEKRGHRLITHCDTEIIPHLFEESQEGMFERLRGQFALALWDERNRRLVLGRDRFGICPLYWTRQGDWLLFASEIKALLASGMVPVEPDLRGLDHIFTFSALPGPITCFKGVQLLPPAHYLQINIGNDRGAKSAIIERAFWKWIFPIAAMRTLEAIRVRWWITSKS